MDTIGKLEEIFRHFPGIGPRQAKRFVYYLLTKSSGDLNELSKLVTELKQSVSVCKKCQRFFPIGVKVATDICSICSDENRDRSTLMVVSRDIDFQSVEKSRAYAGLYFILGGSVPILEDEPEKKIRQRELLTRVEELGEGLSEVIVATNINPEGEHTALHIGKALKPLAEKYKFKITALGRGLSTGTELEYSDSETLKSALENRK
jgi:recombination protein RecR